MNTAIDLANPQTLQKQQAPAVPKQSFADGIRKYIGTSLVGKKADLFVADMVALVNQDPNLKKCDAISLVAAGLQAQVLNLSLNKNMGQAWVIPYNDNNNNRVLATFQIGYKGYLQLAMRSGFYKKINVLAIKETELIGFDPLNEEIEVSLIRDEMAREEARTIGYYTMFEYINGFRKVMYWTKMAAHADRYSPAFSLKATTGNRAKVSFADFEAGNFNKQDAWKYSSFWYKDFDSMAYKTMLRQLLTKWGIMSVEMQQAYEADMRVVESHENGVANLGDIVDAEYSTTGQEPPEEQPAIDVTTTPAPQEQPQAQPTAGQAGKRTSAEELETRRNEAAAMWLKTGKTIEEAEKAVNAYFAKWTAQHCAKVEAMAAQELSRMKKEGAASATGNKVQCPNGGEVDPNTCQDCREFNGCPMWKEA